ncbi:MAG: 30S ribosome-binding factor RbfA [Rhizobiales bacterium]|nr:30S ribosome-binding factor RbfA [Hyphomicrobiales bacterium]
MSRSHHKGGEPSQRMLRVAELIRHAAAELLTRGAVDDSVLAAHVVTVPSVKMSPDLKLATIYVMPLGGKDVKPVVEALEKHKKFLRGEIAHKINMKFAPEIRFRIDESFENAAKIDALLARPEVRRDVESTDGDDEAAE